MKVLLINPPDENTLKTEVPDFLSEERGRNPPLGLLYLASTLQAGGHDVEVLDAQVMELSYGGIKKKIAKAKPEVVGVTAMSFTLIDALLAAGLVKEVDEEIKVVFGGPHPTIYPKETAKLDAVDYAVAGEGEYATLKLVDALENNLPLKGVKGLAYMENGGTVYTGVSDYIKDLDTLPFPARKLAPYKKYSSLLAKRSPITTMFSSRGCPYKCLFCDRPQMGKKFRARSAENVVCEMMECAGMGIREFLVYDDTFTVDRKRVFDICGGIKERDLDVGWDIRARVDTVDGEMLAELKSAGCERIHYGVESGNEDILRILRKGITVRQAEKAFSMTREAGIETLAYFMIGSPHETVETVADTINLAKKLRPDYAHISLTTPFPATDLYRMGLETGVLKSDSWRKYAENPSPDFVPDVWEENLDREKLLGLLRQAYKSFYMRPAYILHSLLRVRSPAELWRKARAGLKVVGA